MTTELLPTAKCGFEIIPLQIEARGEIILNNLPEFRELVREALARINRDLRSDEDFGQAEIDVKALKVAEDSVREAAIKSFDEHLKSLVDDLYKTADEIRVPRLELEKLISRRKEDLKAEIVLEFLEKFDIDPRDARRQFLNGLQTQIKGKRTLESMRAACRIYQTTQQAMIHKSREIVERFSKTHGAEMTPDSRELELKSPEVVEAELRRRFEAKKANEERRRLESETALAKTEAADARAALAEANKPPLPRSASTAGLAHQGPGTPPPIFEVQKMPPPGGEHLTNEVEWRQFRAEVMNAFGPLKAAKQKLLHSQNIAKSQGFANVVNQGFKDWIV